MHDYFLFPNILFFLHCVFIHLRLVFVLNISLCYLFSSLPLCFKAKPVYEGRNVFFKTFFFLFGFYILRFLPLCELRYYNTFNFYINFNRHSFFERLRCGKIFIKKIRLEFFENSKFFQKSKNKFGFCKFLYF